MTLCEHGCGTKLSSREARGHRYELMAGPSLTNTTLHTDARCRDAMRAQLEALRSAAAADHAMVCSVTRAEAAEKRAAEAEQKYETERKCNLANTKELHRCDALLGAATASLRACSAYEERVMRQKREAEAEEKLAEAERQRDEARDALDVEVSARNAIGANAQEWRARVERFKAALDKCEDFLARRHAFFNDTSAAALLVDVRAALTAFAPETSAKAEPCHVCGGSGSEVVESMMVGELRAQCHHCKATGVEPETKEGP